MFINVKTVTADQLPKGESGLVLHINHKDEVVGVTATEDAYARCNPAKMYRHYREAIAHNYDYFRKPQAEGGKGMADFNAGLLTKYPEGWLRFSFQPMSYALARHLSKRIKTLLAEKAEAEGCTHKRREPVLKRIA